VIFKPLPFPFITCRVPRGLNQAFGFQFGIGIRHGGAVNAKHGRELTAGWNAVAGP